MAAIDSVREYLDRAGEGPLDGQSYADWLNGGDVLNFLIDTSDGDIPLYVSNQHFYLYSTFVPLRRLARGYEDDLRHWSLMASGGWGYGYSFGKGERAIQERVFPPIGHTGTRVLDGTEPPVFLREFPGGSPPVYIEMNQKFTHLLGCHWVPARSSFCQFDDNGDYREIIRILDRPGHRLVTVDRTSLDFFLFLTKQVLVRVYDVTRGDHWDAIDHSRRVDESLTDETREIFAHRVGFPALGQGESFVASQVRGIQTIRLASTRHQMTRMLRGEPSTPKQFETFVILDWKHEQVREWSCDPARLGNYFTPSDLPFSTSPVFFRPEVLLKYKADPAKYNLTSSGLSCRSAWSLRTLDINPEGLVFTYLCDLGDLPYSEQIYWKSFNVPPRGGLSERAIRQDFRAEWFTPDDPLERLKALLRAFPGVTYDGKQFALWTLGDNDTEEMFAQLHHVATDSEKEWSDAILTLTKVTVDGLQKKTLRRIARAEQCDRPEHASLKLLRDVLLARGIDADVVREVCDPLADLQAVRSNGIAHLGGKRHLGDFRQEYRERVSSIEESMAQLAEIAKAGLLDLPRGGHGTDATFAETCT